MFGDRFSNRHDAACRAAVFIAAGATSGRGFRFGAVITYHLRDGVKTLKEQRQEAEKAAEKKGEAIPYPTVSQFRAEAEEEPPAVLLTIADSAGASVRTLSGPTGKGFQRVAWDLRVPAPVLPRAPRAEDEDNLFASPPIGPMVMPGRYSATLCKRVGGTIAQIAGPIEFNVLADPAAIVTEEEGQRRAAFEQKLTALRRSISGARGAADATSARLAAIRRAIDATPAAPRALHDQARELQRRLNAILISLRGDTALARRNEPVPPSISERADGVASDLSESLWGHTATHEQVVAIASEEFAATLKQLTTLLTSDLPALEREMEKAGAPWTPGRVPGDS